MMLAPETSPKMRPVTFSLACGQLPRGGTAGSRRVIFHGDKHYGSIVHKTLGSLFVTHVDTKEKGALEDVCGWNPPANLTCAAR